MHHKHIPLAVALFLILLVSCKEEVVAPPPPPPEITVVKVEQEDIILYDEFTGQTYGALDISVRARVEGFLNEIHFVEGSRVRQGELLYVIDPQPYEAKVAEARSRVAEAQTVLVKAESDLARIRPLAEENAVSQADLDAAEAEYGAAQASVEAAKASQDLSEIQMSYSRIHAPISGIIGKTEAKVGDFVGREPNPVLLNTISNIESILVQFSIPEAEYLRIRKAYDDEPPVERENTDEKFIELRLADGSTHPFKGRLDFADREIDPSTGTLLLQASFDNPNRLIRPGQYAKIILPTELRTNALVVPQRCVVELQGQFSVMVVDDQNKVRRQPVVIGETLGDKWLIEEGLTAGDQVIIDALQKVGPDMTVVPKLITFESKTTTD